VGTSALYENSARTKASCAAVTFNAVKPDKFAIRFYCVVSTARTYVHSMTDNRSGNSKQPLRHIVNYFQSYIHHTTTTLLIVQIQKSRLFLPLLDGRFRWHIKPKIYQDPNHKRVIFCDNFYTRHTLATLLKKITDGEAHLVGTCHFNSVDAMTRFYLKQAIEDLKNKPRRSWVLLRAYDKVDNYDSLKQQHTKQQNCLQKKIKELPLSLI
jgi:hypothetical protein